MINAARPKLKFVLDEEGANLQAALHEAFGVAFQIWRPVTDNSVEAKLSGATTNGRLATAHSVDLETLRKAAQPVSTLEVIPIASNRWKLVIPVRTGADVTQIAMAEVQTSSPDLLQRLAQQFSQQQILNRRLNDLQMDADALTRQISIDFEELSYLRSLSEHMAVSEDSSETLQITNSLLPMLRVRIEAESVVMIENDMTASKESASTSFVRVGENVLEDRLCMKLVRRFRDADNLRAVVKNECHRDDDCADFPELRNFIIAPMVRGDHKFGWILAINRLRSSSDPSGSTDWHLKQHEFGTNEESLLKSTASILATHTSNVNLFRDKEQLLVDMVRALVHAIEAKDRYTFGHSERVALYAKELGLKIGLNENDCKRIYLTGLLHDVGKIAIRDTVLGKRGKLDNDEFREIKRHPDEGWSILQGLTALEDVLCGVLHHHERWDGKGYPDGLAGEAIPLECRILAVADAFDAMTSSRPYRTAMALEKSLHILQEGVGTQWDPHVVEVFLQALPKMISIQDNYQLRQPVIRQASEVSGIAAIKF